MVNLYLSDYNLLTSLPYSFTIGQVDGSCIVHINIQGKTIYSTTIYADSSGTANFYELQEIVEQSMRSRLLALATLDIHIDMGGGMESYGPKYIIYNKAGYPVDWDIDFLESHFLVNRTYMTLPRSGYYQLPVFYTGQEDLTTLYADCIFENNGQTYQYHLPMTLYNAQKPNVAYISCGPTSMANLASRYEQDDDMGKLLAYTIHLNSRSMTFYVTDEKPAMTFDFWSAFNVRQTIFIFGSTTLKTDISRKDAVCLGRSSFYNQSVERKHEVQTAPMSIEEAEWFNEFLESHYVTYDINQDYSDMEVLISDITSEISDSAKELVRIKFSWRNNDNMRWIDTDRYPQQFKAQFNDVFK